MNKNSLLKKLILRFIPLFIMWWLLIFLPAWNLNYWQGWIYWLIFFIWMGFALFYFSRKDPGLLERRLKRGPTAEKEKSQKIIQLISTSLTLFMIAFSAIDYRLGLSTVPFYLIITADLLIILSFRILFLVFRENSYASSIIEVSSEQAVISTGPYAVVRHPMYSAVTLMYFSTPIALGSYWAMIFAAGVIISIAFRAYYEEKFLLKNLTDYSDYCKNVRFRLIPLIW